MLAALPLTADVAATVAFSDRTETRLRAPGDTGAGASLDLSTTPDARLVLASSRTSCTLAYTPQLTLWDVNEVGVQPTWLNAGSARVDWRSAHANLWLDEDASYGGMSFADLVLPQGTAGTPPRVDVMPTSQIIQYESTSTTLGSRAEVRRWELRSNVGYQVAGGADDAARQIMPLLKGPLAEAAVSRAASPVDHLATTVSGNETTFSSGPAIGLAEEDEGWKHRWSAVTTTDLTLGIGEGRVRTAPFAREFSRTNLVAEAILDQSILSAKDSVTLHAGARLGPVGEPPPRHRGRARPGHAPGEVDSRPVHRRHLRERAAVGAHGGTQRDHVAGRRAGSVLRGERRRHLRPRRARPLAEGQSTHRVDRDAGDDGNRRGEHRAGDRVRRGDAPCAHGASMTRRHD